MEIFIKTCNIFHLTTILTQNKIHFIYEEKLINRTQIDVINCRDAVGNIVQSTKFIITLPPILLVLPVV
jgi:hypothetical protein